MIGVAYSRRDLQRLRERVRDSIARDAGGIDDEQALDRLLALFAHIDKGLGRTSLAGGARVIVEKPFGRDLASAQELNRVARSVFSEAS